MGAIQILFIYGLAYQVVFGAPAPKGDEGGIPPLITFKDGNIGVNFLGFKASAGLGGLLTGDMSQGGLHAEAETPFGQKAGAGLGGAVDGNGFSRGGLYAGATAGGGVGAGAGLDGMTAADGAVGRSYAGASAGGVGKTVVKERSSFPAYGVGPSSSGAAAASASASADVTGSVHVQKVAPSSKVNIEIIKEHDIPPPPPPPPSASHVHIEFQEEHAPLPPKVKKTYVERTVIPNYVEKTIQVPSYVEKTIRVPTVVEKTIKVPAPPTVIEKEVEVPQPVKTVTKVKEVVVQNDEAPVVPTTFVKTKTKIHHRRPWLHVRKRINYHSNEVPYYGGAIAAGAEAGVTAEGQGSVGAGGTFGVVPPPPPPPPPAVYTTTVRKQFNGNFIKDIFNIPIATLGAVSNLVGNIAGGVGGSVSVSKSYGGAY